MTNRLREFGLITEMVGKEGIVEDRLTPNGREMAIDALTEAEYQKYAIKLMKQMQYSADNINDFFKDINVKRIK